MSTILWIVVALVAVMILLGVVVWKYRKKKYQEPDYRTFFNIGIIWIVFGFLLWFLHPGEFNALLALGLIFFIAGAVNKRKWNKKKKQKLLTINEKILIAIGVAITVVAVAVTILLGYGFV